MSETIEAILRQLQHCLTEHKRCSTHKHAIVKDRHNGTVQFYCGYIPAGKLIFKITDDHLKYGLTPAQWNQISVSILKAKTENETMPELQKTFF